MSSKMKLITLAVLVIVVAASIWFGVRDADMWAVVMLVSVGFIAGLVVGANNPERVSEWKDNVRERVKRLDN